MNGPSSYRNSSQVPVRREKRFSTSDSDSDNYDLDSKIPRYTDEPSYPTMHSSNDSDSQDFSTQKSVAQLEYNIMNNETYSSPSNVSPGSSRSPSPFPYPSVKGQSRNWQTPPKDYHLDHQCNSKTERAVHKAKLHETEEDVHYSYDRSPDAYNTNNYATPLIEKSEDEEEGRETYDSSFVSVNSFVSNNDEENHESDNFRASFSSSGYNTTMENPQPGQKRKHGSWPDPDHLLNNPKISRMMSKMAYKGKGLGKHEQGVTVPIEASKQKGRRGLGFEYVELEEAVKNFKPEDEVVELAEPVEWITYTEPQILDYDDCLDGMDEGPQKLTIDDETNFCDPNILKGILKSKTVFDRLDKNELRHARTRSNPFETIRNGFFQNRAALKMANIDKMCDYIFTRPKSPLNPLNPQDDLIYFADVCAGPGGFSEYVLWRKRHKVKGFGFTLKKSNDFKIEDILAGPKENFHPYYGPFDDINKQGDVFLPENQIAFRDVILEHTNGFGVHFMMADGGFSVEGQENIQEILSKQLYLCQCLVALMIVREGGHFVTKMFDLFTPFSASLVYLMYRCFDSISIIKPNTSRPANSERYLVCKGKRRDTAGIEKYLFYANTILLRKDPNRDIVSLVSMAQMMKDQKFFTYLKNSNDLLGKRQITGLVKIAYYVEEKNLVEPRQASMRLRCLEHWQIPTTVKRMDFKAKSLDSFISKIDPHLSPVYLDMKLDSKILDRNNVKNFQYPYSYYYTILQYDPATSTPEFAPTLYIGLGGSRVYRRVNNNWTKVEGIMLPEETVVYAELVMEYDKEGSKQMKKKALHVIDAYMINGVNLNNLSLQERNNEVKSMCRALWGLRSSINIPVRTKPIRQLRKDIRNQFQLRPVHMKGRSERMGNGYIISRNELSDKRDHESPYFYIPGSVLFLKFTRPPYTRNHSKTTNMFYYFSGEKKETLFEQDMGSRRGHLAGFIEGFRNNVLWPWYHENGLSFDQFLRVIGSQLPL